MSYGSSLKSIQFVELTIHWHIADKMEGILSFLRWACIDDVERLLTSEAIMGVSYDLWVSNGPASVLTIQNDWELFQIAQLVSNIKFLSSVK